MIDREQRRLLEQQRKLVENRAWLRHLTRDGGAMAKVKAGLAAAATILIVAKWLMISHDVHWLMSGGLPH